ncbi:MAG: 30S ribosomal protein S17 [Lentisphaerae bacterium]|nr:30S ribosomal protein S17 [Lentisphaerota bacterium]
MSQASSSSRGVRRQQKGTVVSKSGNKTIVVETERRYRHSEYGKVLRRKQRFHAHDEDNAASQGDKVVIRECRPMSRMKRWVLVSVTQKSAAIAAE